MGRTLTDEDVYTLTQALHDAVVEHCRYRTDPDEHDPHHQFIQMMMEREKLRRERVQKIQDFVAGSLLLAGTLAVIGFLGRAVLAYYRSGGKAP